MTKDTGEVLSMKIRLPCHARRLMLDAAALITKHQGRGVFIDTNLLVLLLVGSVNPSRIPKFKRTQDFSIEDFRVLRELVEWFGKPLVATPHVLSQVSDLTDLSGREAILVREIFRSIVDQIEEQHDNARRLVLHPLLSDSDSEMPR